MKRFSRPDATGVRRLPVAAVAEKPILFLLNSGYLDSYSTPEPSPGFMSLGRRPDKVRVGLYSTVEL